MKARVQSGAQLLPLAQSPATAATGASTSHTCSHTFSHACGRWAGLGRLTSAAGACRAWLAVVPLYCYAVMLGLTLLSVELLLVQPQPRAARNDVPVPRMHTTGRINGSYPVPMGYWTSHVDYTFPHPDPHYSHTLGFVPWWLSPMRKDCFQLAKAVSEPYSASYRPRPGVPGPGPFPGGAPRALFRWDPGRITRQQFDGVPHWLRGAKCMHCVDALRFKIYKGQVWGVCTGMGGYG